MMTSTVHFCGNRGRCTVAPFCHIHAGSFDNLGKCDVCGVVTPEVAGLWIEEDSAGATPVEGGGDAGPFVGSAPPARTVPPPREVALSDRTIDDEPERWKRDLIADGIAEAERRQRPPYPPPLCPWCSVFIVDGEDREPFNGRLFHKGCLSDMQTRDVEDVWE